MQKFEAEIAIIGINPYVFVPDDILKELFIQAGKEKGFIPIRGSVNNKPYLQTLVKYKGAWRLYINMLMLKNSPSRIGETIEVSIEFDSEDRSIEPHPSLVSALNENKEAKAVFDGFTPSKKNEIVRYISRLKTDESITKNVKRAIAFLNGNVRFIGRDKP